MMKQVNNGGSNPWMFVSILLGTLLVASFLSNIYIISKVTNFGSAQVPTQGNAPNAPSAPTPNAPTPTQRVEVSENDDAALGDEDAPVTIIEFSDYECPFCGRHFQQTYPQIKKDYIDTGKVRLVFRDFPLSFHPNAQKAAEAAECAGEQGKYFEMHDKLFQNQQALSVANLKQYAADLKLNTEDFNECLDSGEMAAEVQQDMAEGSAAGVSGTPSFFVNGKLIVGAQPYAAFQQAIEAELAAQ